MIIGFQHFIFGDCALNLLFNRLNVASLTESFTRVSTQINRFAAAEGTFCQSYRLESFSYPNGINPYRLIVNPIFEAKRISDNKLIAMRLPFNPFFNFSLRMEEMNASPSKGNNGSMLNIATLIMMIDVQFKVMNR